MLVMVAFIHIYICILRRASVVTNYRFVHLIYLCCTYGEPFVSCEECNLGLKIGQAERDVILEELLVVVVVVVVFEDNEVVYNG